MKRTIVVFVALGLWGTVGAAAQQPAAPAPAAPQAGPIDGIVAAMQAAEQRASRFTVELTTSGQLPGDLALSTRGVLHVLRGAQPAVHTAVEFSFADGLGGRVESAQTAAGIVLYEENPAFGELYLRFAPELVADLEWAGSVLGRSDLPGMADRRAMAPLGSTMLVELQREFALGVVDGRRDRAGEPGAWLAGPRRGGLDDDGSGQPMADRVEVFVRDRDHALVEANWLQGERRVQQIVVQRLEVDGDLPPALFTVDGRGQRLRDVQQHQPMWDQIQQVLQKAEAKAPEGAVRPSRR